MLHTKRHALITEQLLAIKRAHPSLRQLLPF